MIKKLSILLICFLLFAILTQSVYAWGLLDFVRLANSIRNYYKTVSQGVQVAKTGFGYVPHGFPFGGHITSSERACSFKFWVWPLICYPVVGCIQTPCPNCGYIPLSGRAIKVGPPLASPGKIIEFPWITDSYRNDSQNRVGPWTLGLGFTPFPLKQINDILGKISLPNPLQGCGPQNGNGGPVCFDHFHIDCQASGEKDQAGNDIYKVIRKIGTSVN
ncbi:MAG: hypothetical protein A3C61_02155 [Candidatus Yanofskybacteria bacterium RIFCSPHIGHO2_02_FULL_39_10]|uniref:Uncharacterized protein n=1 Tax=Candidatus Yanofskybacteria bacterium RIFCSPHIGHO2_02_FULL_39_10 TaxID=1802674 RepID=A0A1F8F4E9_9BACT|nr:MAG: hypothetical protein A3C61_02155 [Candidatus Yanofskybacteria bacterium RIFCSPHIGHO2_02_FULL_39_10]